MIDSNFLLLVVPNTKKNKGIVMGKLFEYIRSMTKIIMIGPTDSDAAKIINETSSGKCFGYKDSFKICEYLDSNENSVTINFEKYSRKNLTSKIVELFEEVAQNNDT